MNEKIKQQEKMRPYYDVGVDFTPHELGFDEPLSLYQRMIIFKKEAIKKYVASITAESNSKENSNQLTLYDMI